MSNLNMRYVERQEQMQLFEKLLRNPRADDRVYPVIGPGGIGKTWLVKAMIEKARQSTPSVWAPSDLIDMFATDHRYIEGVIDAIVVRLEELAGANLFARYRRLRSSSELTEPAIRERRSGYGDQIGAGRLMELTQAFRDDLAQIVNKRPVVLAFDTFENVQDGPVGQWILDPQGLQMPGLICIIASRRKWKEDQPVMGGLTDKQALDFYRRYTQSDEPVTPRLEAEVSRLNAKVKGNPLLLGLAITWWQGDPAAFDQLDKLSDEEFKKQIIWSLHSTAGLGLRNLGGIELDEPMYQILVMISVMNRRFNRFFLERLIKHKYVRLEGASVDSVWNALQRPQLFFVKQRPNNEIQLHDVLAEMLREHLLLDVLGTVFGEEVDQKWQALTRDIASWYDEILSARTAPETGEILRSEKLAYVFQLDAPSSLQRPDATTALGLLTEYKQRRSEVLDRLVVSEFTRRPSDNLLVPEDGMVVDRAVRQFSAWEKYEVYRMLGEMGADGRLFEQSVRCWMRATEAEREMDAEERYELQIKALIGQHNSTWPDHPEKSQEILDQALSLCDHAPHLRGQVLYEKGFAYRQLQDLERAIEYYEQAREHLETYRDRAMMATVLNDMGYAYLLLGDNETADAHIKMAQRLRQAQLDEIDAQIRHIKKLPATDNARSTALRKLQEQRSEANLQLGWTFNTIGEAARFIGKLRTAEKAYSRAYAIFRKERNHFWQARALFSRGEANRRYAVKFYEENDPEYKVREERARRDIEQSLELCRQYGLVHIRSTAHRRLGRLYHDQALRTHDREKRLQLLEQALKQFEEGLGFAIQCRDMLEELENLTEIAFLADDMAGAQFPDGCPDPHLLKREYGLIERLRSALEEKRKRQSGDGRPLVFQFGVFENLLEIELGAYYFVLRDFDTSLQHYLKGYVGLAADPGYGLARYRQHIGHLFGNIARLSHIAGMDLARVWCDRFIEALQVTKMLRRGQTVAEAHPEFVTAFRNHRSVIGLL